MFISCIPDSYIENVNSKLITLGESRMLSLLSFDPSWFPFLNSNSSDIVSVWMRDIIILQI